MIRLFAALALVLLAGCKADAEPRPGEHLDLQTIGKIAILESRVRQLEADAARGRENLESLSDAAEADILDTNARVRRLEGNEESVFQHIDILRGRSGLPPMARTGN